MSDNDINDDAEDVIEFMRERFAPDVFAELTDPRFPKRQHYSRSLYYEGCHGPLCRKAESDRARRKTKYVAESEGRKYVPRPKMREALGNVKRDEELARVIGWHLNECEIARAVRRAS